MGAAASSRIRIFRGWLPRQVCLLPARGGEKPIEGYARRSSWDAFSGRGFDSHHLHQVSFLQFQTIQHLFAFERGGHAALVRRPEHAHLGDDRRDQLGRGDVEGEVEGLRVLRGDAGAEDLGDLQGLALLDGDGRAVRRGAVDRREGRRHVEGHLVAVGQHGHRVGADLVGGVAVGRDAVGAHHDAVHQPLRHEGAGAAVGHQPEGDAQALELPGGEAGALEEGTRLVHPNLPDLPLAPGGLDHPQGRAIAGRGQGAGVAMGEDAGPFGEKRRAVRADAAIDPHVVRVQLAGPGEERRRRRLGTSRHACREDLPPPLQGPPQVHRRGPGAPQQLQDLFEAAGEALGIAHGANPEDQSVRCGHADGRRAPHGQPADGVRHLLGGLAVHPDLLHGEARLVEEEQSRALPAHGGEGLGLGRGGGLGLGHGAVILSSIQCRLSGGRRRLFLAPPHSHDSPSEGAPVKGDPRNLGFSTRAIHAGQEPDPRTGAVAIPIYQTSTYVQHQLGEPSPYEYARVQNPTRSALEEQVSQLEGGHAGHAFASGMSAIEALMTLLKAGDNTVVSRNVYGGTFRYFTRLLERWGITVSWVDTTDVAAVEAAIRPETKIVYLESPTNPVMDITDIAAVAKMAHARGARVAVDNTFLSPYLQRPLELGADFVVHSTTKFLNGHSDSIGGVLISSTAEDAEWFAFIQKSIGAILSPFDSFLTMRGIKTLAVRQARHEENARRMVDFLVEHPKVQRVLYPGLPDHPGHEIQKRQARGFGSMITLELGSFAAAKTMLERVRVISFAESVGGDESVISHPARMTHGPVPPERRAA